jgi:hypothetical protein
VSRRRGFSRVNARNQVTLSIQILHDAGIRPGDRLRAEALGSGTVLLVRDNDPVSEFAGALTGVYRAGELDRLRREWD